MKQVSDEYKNARMFFGRTTPVSWSRM